MKHNKKRNTGFIYETLTRELTQTIVRQDVQRKRKIVFILKEFFSKGGPLACELQLYRTLLETSSLQENVAERLLQETKWAHEKLDKERIFDMQSAAIAAINKGLGQKVWANFVPNFKSLASVNAIFNSKTSVKKKVLFEHALVDRMSKQTSPHAQTKMKSLDSLAYNSFITKFNNKYSNLLGEQKDLLNRVITSFADDGFELQIYLNEELSRLKNLVNTVMETIDEPLVAQKLEGVREYLEEFRRREFTDTDLNKILKTQELMKELTVHDNN